MSRTISCEKCGKQIRPGDDQKDCPCPGCREEFLQFRNILIELQDRAYSRYNQTLITLSTAVIGVSVVIAKDLGLPLSWLLFVSWICWTATCVLALCGYFRTARKVTERLWEVDKNYESDSDVVSEQSPQTFKHEFWVTVFNSVRIP